MKKYRQQPKNQLVQQADCLPTHRQKQLPTKKYQTWMGKCGSLIPIFTAWVLVYLFTGCGENAGGPTNVSVVDVSVPPVVASSPRSSEDSINTGKMVENTSLPMSETSQKISTETTSDTSSQTFTDTPSDTQTSTETAFVTTAAADSNSGGDSDPFYSDIKIMDPAYGTLMLVNKQYRLPDDFEQTDLVDIPSNYHVMDGKEYKLQKDAAEAFYEMSDAAWNDSGGRIDLRIVSGYRSHSYQDWLYNHYANTYGKEAADTYSARPRHSEHETGLCCDIDMVEWDYEETDNYKWLVENAADYGFILRYERGKEHITGYIYEPWHWRYVGSEIAKALKQYGLTYDEYFLNYVEGTVIE